MSRSKKALLAVVFAALAACSITQPAPIKQSFLLDPTVPAGTAGGHAHVLRVNRFVVAQPFDGRSLVYRVQDQRYESDYYNEFLARPATMFTEGAMRYLAGSGTFRAAVPMNSSVDARYVLEASVASLHGDFRADRAPAAVLAIRFLLARDDAAGGLAYERLIERRVELNARSASALVSGLDTAYIAILGDLARDLRALHLPAPATPAAVQIPR